MRMKRTMSVCASLILVAVAGRSWGDRDSTDTPIRPEVCADAHYREFDFWIGDWDVFDVERPSAIVAHARVELILNRCVLHEIYEDLDGHKGESFSLYDATRKTWHQSWVNDSGYLLTIEGNLQGASMILEGLDHLPSDKLRQVRGEWRPDGQGAREIAWRSTDGGATWVAWFDLSFRPHLANSRPAAR
jgi:hypothetical protein